MSQIIPTLEVPFYSIRVRLDDSDFALRFRYSVRTDRWWVTLSDSEDVSLCQLKLVTGISLLRAYRYRGNLPIGELVVAHAGENASPPTLLELGEGKRCQLVYFPLVEITRARIELGLTGQEPTV